MKRSVLENLNNGYLVNDTIVIKYTIELVVSTGGALTRQAGPSAPKLPLIQVRLLPLLPWAPRLVQGFDLSLLVHYPLADLCTYLTTYIFSLTNQPVEGLLQKLTI